MTTTLTRRFESSKQAAKAALEDRAQQQSAEEADIADARVRLEAERLLDFYDELSDPVLSSIVPTIAQSFISYDDACSRMISDALTLASRPLDENAEVKEYSELLNHIDDLQQETKKLECSILSISKSATHVREARVVPALVTLLPVVRARSANLTSARTLVQRSKDNLTISLQIQSLQLTP